jgi:hypothetical protein
MAEIETLRVKLGGEITVPNPIPSPAGKNMSDSKNKNAADKLAAYVDRHVNKTAFGAPVLWQYTDPEGNNFWLDRKLTTSVRSPYGGPAFMFRPTKVYPSQLGKALKEEDLGSGLGDFDEPL